MSSLYSTSCTSPLLCLQFEEVVFICFVKAPRVHGVRAQVKLIIESQQHSCRTADEIFLDSRPLKASTSSQRCVLCTCVFMYLCICESSRCISPLEAVQSINFPLKMCPRLAEKLFGPNLNPFFLQQLKRSVFYSMQFKPFVVFHSILQHVVFHSILQLKLSVLYFTA